MSSKQDRNFEQKMAKEAAEGENVNDMGTVIIAKGPSIKFPNETWEEIVMWIKRFELAERVSLTSDRLFCNAYPFIFQEKKYMLPNLIAYTVNDEICVNILSNIGAVKKVLPKSQIPSVEPPVEINNPPCLLTIRTLNNDALQFVQLLVPIYSAVFINLSGKLSEERNAKVKEFLQMFADKMKGLVIGKGITSSELQEHCAISMDALVYINCVHEVTEQEFYILKQWLYQSSGDDTPKVLKICYSPVRKLIKTLKEDFLSADQPTSFLIEFRDREGSMFWIWDGDLASDIINSSTRECLTIYPKFGIPLNSPRFRPREWIAARLPEDCHDSPLKIINNMDDYLRCLPTIHLPAGMP